MNDPVHALILDLLEWIAPRPRPYAEVIDAWRTSCPRLPVWEEATDRKLLELRHERNGALMVCLTAAGRELLKRERASSR